LLMILEWLVSSNTTHKHWSVAAHLPSCLSSSDEGREINQSEACPNRRRILNRMPSMTQMAGPRERQY
jgi:hypothetical protein